MDLEENQAEIMAEQKRLTSVQSVFLANKMGTMAINIDHILQAETGCGLCTNLHKIGRFLSSI